MSSQWSKSQTATYWEAIAFITVISIIGLNASLAYRTTESLSEKHSSITTTGATIATIKDLGYAIAAAESGKRGFLLTDDEDFLIPYHDALSNLDKNIAAVHSLSFESREQKNRITQLLRLVDRKVSEIKKVVDLAAKHKDRTAMKIVMSGEGRALYTEIFEIFEAIEISELTRQKSLNRQFIQAQKNAKYLFYILLAISCMLVIGLLLLHKHYIKREREHSLQLEKRAEELELKIAERTQEITLFSQELSRSNQELEDFAFVASHDLQEPLRKIRAFAGRVLTLYENKIDAKGSDYLHRLNNAASRMSSLIEDLLEFSRIKTRGREFVSTNLTSIVKLAIDDLEIAIEDSGATIELSGLPTIDADPSQMGQLFLNIISNALKFRNQHVPPKITISYAIVKHLLNDVCIDYHQIVVTDNGIGFDPNYSDKIFLPFQRLHGRDEFKGNGIGLAVCRRITERHGGQILVQSTPGQGASFSILIPLAAMDFDTANSA